MTATRIGIDAPFPGTGSEGGAEHSVIGLLSGLGKLTDGDEEYHVLVPAEATDWLQPFLGPNQLLVREPAPHSNWKEKIKRGLGPLKKPIGNALRQSGLLPKPNPLHIPAVPVSNGFVESLRLDALHLLYPLHFYKSTIPTLLTVHDLQHRHFPEFFQWNDLPWRESLYPQALAHSQLITTISWWVGRDLMQQYQTPAERIRVVPWASPTQCYQTLKLTPEASIVQKYQLTEPFVLYPSVTYGHKNHIRLLEAIAKLRDRDGVRINVICTGWKKLHWPKIQLRQKELDLENQVRFIGYLPAEEMKSIYRLSRFVIFPSLFEGCGLALLEAFEEGKAAAASDIPPFREYGLNAPHFFNPTDVQSMAEVIKLLWLDEKVREFAVARGNAIARNYQWEKVALSYRAIYRLMLGKVLSSDDQRLLTLASFPPITPNRSSHLPLEISE